MIKILRYLYLNVIDRLELLSKCQLSLSDWFGLKRTPRYTRGEIGFLGKRLCYGDSSSLMGGLVEIFGRECYCFQAQGDAPYIIDCGSNIGLSLLYFKKRYPKAEILAFEADPDIFRILAKNIDNYGLDRITPRNKAVWHANTTISFQAEGGFSGRAAAEHGPGLISLDAIRLRDYLDRPVDLLKIDIEGAEFEVLDDCRDRLGQVKNLFVEYHSLAGQKQVLGDLLNILSQCGYRYHVKEAYTVERPFVERQTLAGMDLQLDIFAYRDHVQ